MKVSDIEKFKENFAERLNSRLMRSLAEDDNPTLDVEKLAQDTPDDSRLARISNEVRRCMDVLGKSIREATNGNPQNPDFQLDLQKIEDAFFSEITVSAEKDRTNPGSGLPEAVTFVAKDVFSGLVLLYLPPLVPRAQVAVLDQKEESDDEDEIQSTLPLKPLVKQILDIKEELDKVEADERTARELRRAEVRAGATETFEERETAYEAELRRACAAVVLNLKTHYGNITEARTEAIIKEMKGLILDQIIDQADQAHLALRASAAVVLSLKPSESISQACIEATIRHIKGLALDEDEALLVFPGAKQKYEEIKGLALDQVIVQANQANQTDLLARQKYEGAKKNYEGCYSGTEVDQTTGRRTTVEFITDWLKTNKQNLVNTHSSLDTKVLEESRLYLSQWESNLQAAWRNFDVGARVNGVWRPCLVGTGNGIEGDLIDIALCRESLAYYYIAFTDLKEVLTPEASAVFIGQLITQLGIARRGHSDDDPNYATHPEACLDRVSCPPGYRTRIGRSGNGHRIAHVSVRSDLVQHLIRISINERTAKFFKELPDFASKKAALASFYNISSGGSAKEILDDEVKISHKERNLREQAIKAFGLHFNLDSNNYEIDQDIYQWIQNELLINATANALNPYNVVVTPLNARECSQILYNFLDPIAYYRGVIQYQFEQSLSPEELKLYKKKPVSQPTAAQARTLASAYEELFQKETTAASDAFDQVNENSKDDVLAFRARFEPGAVTLSIIKELKAEGIFGNEEAIVRGVAQIQKKNLLDKYLRASLSEHDQKRNKTYHLKQAAACTSALADSRLDWNVLSRTGTEKEKNTVKSAMMDELTLAVLGGLEGIQSLSPSEYKEVKENQEAVVKLKAVSKQKFVRQDAYVGVGNVRFRQSLGVANTGPLGEDTGVMGVQIGYPRMPVVHPYHPVGDNPATSRNNGIPTFSIAMAFPRGTVGNLPAGVLEQLRQYNIAIGNLDVFWSVQDMPWQGEQLLLRPHPWLHPDAPQERGARQNSNILVGICDIDSSMSSVTAIQDVCTHPDVNGHMVYSERQMPIMGIETAPNSSHSFYSLCIDPDTGRAALTLHWLLNGSDQQEVQAVVQGADDVAVEDLVEMLSVMLPPSSDIVDKPFANRWTPLDALNALQGEQPQPTTPNAQHKPRYRLGKSVTEAASPAIQHAHQLAEALFLAKRFSDESNLVKRRKLLLTAMDEAQYVQNPATLVPGTQELASEEVSVEQQNRYFQLLLKAYLEAFLSPGELNRLKKVAQAGELQEAKEMREQITILRTVPQRPQPVQVAVAVVPARPVTIHAAPVANAAAQREAEAQQRAREERARQDAAAARALQEAEARRVEAARLAEVERLRLAAAAPRTNPLAARRR